MGARKRGGWEFRLEGSKGETAKTKIGLDVEAYKQTHIFKGLGWLFILEVQVYK